MRYVTLTAAVLATAGFIMAQDEAPKPAAAAPAEKPASAVPPATTPENVSYAIGTMIAGNLKQQGLKVDLAELNKGIADVLEGKKPRMDEAQCKQVLVAYQQQQRQDQQKGGAAFLEKNGKREGVVTTASGLQYEVLKKGEGAKPKATDKVKVHYHGTLIDGKVFDSSVDRGEPISFPLNGVIKGWTEGLQLMPTGAKFKFFIPSDLAYGPDGQGPDIGPNAVLIFDVELLAIE
jgi:FKBP-type peptidyl-prolyl cis-trans isomerase FklB